MALAAGGARGEGRPGGSRWERLPGAPAGGGRERLRLRTSCKGGKWPDLLFRLPSSL